VNKLRSNGLCAKNDHLVAVTADVAAAEARVEVVVRMRGEFFMKYQLRT